MPRRTEPTALDVHAAWNITLDLDRQGDVVPDNSSRGLEAEVFVRTRVMPHGFEGVERGAARLLEVVGGVVFGIEPPLLAVKPLEFYTDPIVGSSVTAGSRTFVPDRREACAALVRDLVAASVPGQAGPSPLEVWDGWAATYSRTARDPRIRYVLLRAVLVLAALGDTATGAKGFTQTVVDDKLAAQFPLQS
ncbi:hypothetical protein [Streptomyces sp. NPDC001743]|uniref:hypothetical protein n=1 Tax=Streptomyces sp. NPDC001743 TaxID=3154397 RepID=UPI0033257FA3